MVPLHAAKFSGQVWLCLAGVWLVVLACTVASIYAQAFSPRQQKFWLAVVIFVPVLGILAYLPFSFRREQLAHLFFMRQQKPRGKKGLITASLPGGGRGA